MLTSRWRTASVMLIVAGVVGVAGCSSGGATSAASPAATPAVAAPAQLASAAQVATGMRKIDELAQGVAQSAGTDKTKAASLVDQIEPTWRPFEDTVKRNDQDAYLAMEDSFAVLENAADNGNAAAAAKGSAMISSTVQAYLAKYSG